MTTEEKIRLTASTDKDLKIISYLCQDAIFSNEEILFDKEKKIFIATFSRYCWEKEESNISKKNQSYFRVVSGLQIQNVNSVNYKNFNTKDPFLNLLAITNKKNKIILHFSKSIEIMLIYEKMSVLIEDIDVPWPTKLKPKHDI